MQTVTLKLPVDLLQSAHAAAVNRDETVAKMLEELIVRELSNRAEADKASLLEDRLVFALQSLLFRDMAEASSWLDLSDRLDSHGYWLKLTREGLILHTESSGRPICNCADLGFGYVTFLRRFGAGGPRDPYTLQMMLPEQLPLQDRPSWTTFDDVDTDPAA